DCYVILIGLSSRYTHFPYTTLFRSDGCSSISGVSHTPSTCGSFSMKSHTSQACHSLNVNGGSSCFARSRSSRNRCAAFLKRLPRSEEHTSELQSRENLVCRLLLENI